LHSQVNGVLMRFLSTALLGIVLAAAGLGQMRGELDIAYGDGGDQQKLDLYLPAKKGFATVMFTYGGGWRSGGRKSVTDIGKKLQTLGFGCALISHRLAPTHKFPAQIEDVAAAFAWLKKNIAAKGGDPGRMYVMGHSSGAHLTLLLAADPKYLMKHGLSPADIRAVIALSTPVDLEPRASGKGFGDALMAGKGADVFSRDPAIMKDASPLQHVSGKLPRTLLIVGERDFPMLEGDAKAFSEKAKKSGVSVALFLAKDADHMDVVRQLVRDDSAVLNRVLAFLMKVEE
jgi:acetyl esterase/lipase